MGQKPAFRQSLNNGERVTWGYVKTSPPWADALAWARDAEDTDDEEFVLDLGGLTHRSPA